MFDDVWRCLMMFDDVWYCLMNVKTTLRALYYLLLFILVSALLEWCLSDAWVMLEWFLSDAKRVMRAQRRDLQASGSFWSVLPAGAGNWSLASAVAVRETDHYTSDVWQSPYVRKRPHIEINGDGMGWNGMEWKWNGGKQNDRKQHLSHPNYPCVPEYVGKLWWDTFEKCAGVC